MYTYSFLDRLSNIQILKTLYFIKDIWKSATWKGIFLLLKYTEFNQSV